jgi:hypothetical protein
MPAIAPQTPAETAAGVWTDSSRIHQALSDAEARFGPRNPAFQLQGFIYRADLLRPILSLDTGAMTLELWLPACLQGDLSQIAYQAAHEMIHVLVPAVGKVMTIFEEGLATLFSEQHMRKRFNMSATVDPQRVTYVTALAAVRKYLVDDNSVRAIRAVEPGFSNLTPQLLRQVNRACSQADAEFLCSAFQGS